MERQPLRPPPSLLAKWGRNIKNRRSAFRPDGEVRGPSEPKMSQEHLADLLGVKQSTVSRWESGASEPGYMSKVALAALLRTDVDLLFPILQPEIYEPGRVA